MRSDLHDPARPNEAVGDARASKVDVFTDLFVRLPSFTARISSDCPQILHGLASIYPVENPSGQRATSLEHPPFVTVQHSRNGHSAYRVAMTNGESHIVQSESNAVLYLDWLLNSAAAARLSRHLLMHSGAVATERGAILLPGVSGAGKSTLVAALCMAGFKYLSDEIAVLSLRSGRALPFPKPICLKDGGWRALADRFRLPPSLFEATRADGEIVRYLVAPRSYSPRASVRVRHVVLPRYRKGSRSTAEPISRIQAITELAECSLNFPRHGRQALETLARMVEGAECRRLTYDDPVEAVVLLSDAIGRHDLGLVRGPPRAAAMEA